MRIVLTLIAVLLVIAAGLYAILRHGVVRIETEDEKPAADLRKLQALPYLAHVEDDPNPDVSGVTVHEEALAFEGLNLLTSLDMGSSHLLDMKGNVLRSWHAPDSIQGRWIHAELDRDGNLFVIAAGAGLLKLDWDSRLVWISRPSDNPYLNKRGEGYHHDLELAGSGDIYVLAQERRRVTDPYGEPQPKRPWKAKPPGYEIRDNSIVVLSPEGTPRSKISFYDLAGELLAAEIKKQVEDIKAGLKSRGVVPVMSFDIFHANTVEEILMDIGVARKGDLLFCIRNLDLIGTLDIEKEEIAWIWGPNVLERPHNSSLLANGHILVFDNGLRERGYSRVLEVDPGTGEIVWQYESDPREDFFSPVMGGNQRLPGGNTLITESTEGRVFEVTGDGKVVWEFLNFETSKDAEHEGKRSTIYRMIRYDPQYLRRALPR